MGDLKCGLCLSFFCRDKCVNIESNPQAGQGIAWCKNWTYSLGCPDSWGWPDLLDISQCLLFNKKFIEGIPKTFGLLFPRIKSALAVPLP